LAPADNCKDALKAIPDGLVVTPVANIDDAVKALEAFAAGQSVPSCTP
jgi:PDZ domain-containing protein